jgi:hypothetical protein
MQITAFNTPLDPSWRWRIVNDADEIIDVVGRTPHEPPPRSRRPMIAGGSDDDHQLRTTIRDHLADRTLPRIDGRAWAVNGTGNNACACCGNTISRLDRELKPQAVDGLYAHGPCFTVWLAESFGLRVYDRHRDGRSRRAEPR